MTLAFWLLALAIGMAAIVWGSEAFAEHLGQASVQLGVSTFALALLLAGAEPEELVTSIIAALRGSPGIALGDVIGANVTICLVALGAGASIAPVPFGAAVMSYALLGLPLGVVCAWFAWDGEIGRLEGVTLLALYAAFVGGIWWGERKPPSLGEVGEVAEARDAMQAGRQRRVGRDLVMVLAGVVAMAAGASLLVEAVRRISSVEATQTRIGLTLVGFATGFELVVLAWSAARRGIPEAAIAGVVGSFAYNVTATLGAGAIARPLVMTDSGLLHLPLLLMLVSLLSVVLLAAQRQQLSRADGIALLAGYPLFVTAVLFA